MFGQDLILDNSASGYRESGTAWKGSVLGDVLIRTFTNLDWIRRDTPLRSQSECGKIRNIRNFTHFLRSEGLITVIDLVGLRHIRRTLNMYKYHRTKIASLRIDQQKKLSTIFPTNYLKKASTHSNFLILGKNNILTETIKYCSRKTRSKMNISCFSENRK